MSRLGGQRIAGAIIALAVVGTVVGYLAGLWSHDEPNESGKATPLMASSPSAPIDPPVKIKPDNDYPPLGVDLEYEDATLGSGDFAVTLPVPTGWEGHPIAAGETRWYPSDADPNTMYALRVKQVSGEHTAVESMVEKKERALDSASSVKDFEVLSKSSDTLTVSYVDADSKLLRVQILRWIEPRGSGEAEIEIAVAGRMVDRNGLDRLIDYVSDRIAPG